MNDIFVKCINCKKDKNIIHFMKKGKQLKRCEDCRDYYRKYTIKNKCPCGKRKEYCKLHGGSQYCPCGTYKYHCKIHNDARIVVIQCMINNSRNKDKKYNRFDENQFIDKQFVSNLLDLYENCFYCNCKLNFDKRNPNLATIERLDNTLGHIKRNCVIACFTCNVNHVGDKLNQ